MTDWGPEEIAEREADQAEAEAMSQPEACSSCLTDDAWKCAKMRRLSTDVCQCKCHEWHTTPAPSPSYFVPDTNITPDSIPEPDKVEQVLTKWGGVMEKLANGAISPDPAIRKQVEILDEAVRRFGPTSPGGEPAVSELLGKYLNTMVVDLGIMDKGQYLRELFSRYEAERDAENADLRRQLQERQQISKGWRDSFDREVETHDVTRKLLVAEREPAKTAERQLQERDFALDKMCKSFDALKTEARDRVAQLEEALRGLSNEIKGWLGLDRGELTQLLSVTNIRVMERKLAEAEAALRGEDKLGSEKEQGK